mgnify:CR=1 FL=1
MAETRKYEPTTGDPVGDAVRAALGENIRPVTPGSEKPKSDAPASATPETPPAPPAAVKPTVATLGAFVFTAPPKK